MHNLLYNLFRLSILAFLVSTVNLNSAIFDELIDLHSCVNRLLTYGLSIKSEGSVRMLLDKLHHITSTVCRIKREQERKRDLISQILVISQSYIWALDTRHSRNIDEGYDLFDKEQVELREKKTAMKEQHDMLQTMGHLIHEYLSVSTRNIESLHQITRDVVTLSVKASDKLESESSGGIHDDLTSLWQHLSKTNTIHSEFAVHFNLDDLESILDLDIDELSKSNKATNSMRGILISLVIITIIIIITIMLIIFKSKKEPVKVKSYINVVKDKLSVLNKL